MIRVCVCHRGTTDTNEVEAAFEAMDTSTAPPPEAAAPAPAAEPAVTPSAADETNATQQHSEPLSNDVTPAVRVERSEQTHTDGNTVQHVTTETSTQQFGGTTLTKHTTTREEVRQAGLPNLSAAYPVREHQISPMAAPAKPTVFQPSPQSQQRGVWQPSGAKIPLKVTSAPRNVKVEHNVDRSVTMSFGLSAPSRDDVKENISPARTPVNYSAPPPPPAQPMPTNKRPGCWHPSYIPDMPPQRAPSPPEPAPKYEKLPAPVENEPSHFPFWEQWAKEEPETLARFTYQHLMNILTGPGGDEWDGQDSPMTFFKKKSKFCWVCVDLTSLEQQEYLFFFLTLKVLYMTGWNCSKIYVHVRVLVFIK